jgi:hypothetical protein
LLLKKNLKTFKILICLIFDNNCAIIFFLQSKVW